MKRVLILFLMFLLASGTTFAAECCSNKKQYDFDTEYKCSQLIEKIRAQKNTLYNVLGLSAEQQKIKDEIELRRKAEMKPYTENFQCERKKLLQLAKTSYKSKEFKKQEKVTKKAWKDMHRIFKKYDKEFYKILCSTQKTKYKEIVKLTKRDIKYCRLNRKACPKDPYMNTFGKNDAKNACEVCPKHTKHHPLNFKCTPDEP